MRLAVLRSWTTAEFAQLLGTTAAEARELLEGFGFTQDQDGAWRRPADASSDFAEAILRALTSYEAFKRDEAAVSESLREALDIWLKRNAPD